MSKLKYQMLMDEEPTVYATITNNQGQELQFVEHPYEGDEYPIIVVYHAEKLAYASDFWDMGDFTLESDYMPVFVDGKMLNQWEVE